MRLLSKISNSRWSRCSIASVGLRYSVMNYAPYCTDLPCTEQEATTQTSGAFPFSRSLSQLCMTSRVFIVIELVAMTVMLSILWATMLCTAESMVGIQRR